MLVTENDALPGGSSLLRNEPVQARSSARLTGLLDAAAAIIDEIGFERLTTAMVAERAGASIGTVYRYFPDRIAVVEALAVRCVQRLAERVTTAIESSSLTDWRNGIDLLVDAKVEMYRSEPGFRAIRFVDGASPERPAVDPARRPLAERIATCLVDRFGVDRTPQFEFAIDMATEIGSALIARAFLDDADGDERIVAECRSLVTSYLTTATVVPK